MNFLKVKTLLALAAFVEAACTLGSGTSRPPGPAASPFGLDRVLLGYQGWFGCPGDGAPGSRWRHWYRDQDLSRPAVDLLPDVSELDDDEICPGPHRLFSSYRRKTVIRHFRWMNEHRIDGIWLQRFVVDLDDFETRAFRNHVAQNVRVGAEAHARVYALMYDISGAKEETLVTDIIDDWENFVGPILRPSVHYLKHNAADGKPVLGLWGFGFLDRPGTPAQALAVINYFHEKGFFLVGGVPVGWRFDAAWKDVYDRFDIISPWTVGRFWDAKSVKAYVREMLVPDLERAGRDRYLAVIWPGFSRQNIMGGPLDDVPRRKAAFLREQLVAFRGAGVTAFYGAMFDEYDEGTAFAPARVKVPRGFLGADSSDKPFLYMEALK